MSDVKNPLTGETIQLSSHQIDRQKIRYLYVTKPHKMSKHLLIGIVTEDFMYFEIDRNYSYITSKKTPSRNARIAKAFAFSNAFKSFYLDTSSYVSYSADTVNIKDPIFVYLKMLQQHIRFSMQKSTTKSVLARVNFMKRSNYVIKKKKKKKLGVRKVWSRHITKDSLDKMWQVFLDNGACPWINRDVDAIILKDYDPSDVRHNGGKSMVATRKLLRFAMFYMVIIDSMRLRWKTNPSAKKIIQETAEKHQQRQENIKKRLLALQDIFNRRETSEEETENETE